VTAARLAEELEITPRTIYRDMNTLEAMGVPIRGEAGVGYVLESGYDLPPMMFNEAELDTLVLALRLLDHHADEGLRKSANDILTKIKQVLPEGLSQGLADVPFLAPRISVFEDTERKIDIETLRKIIRREQQLRIEYISGDNQCSQRIIWPILMGFFDKAQLVVGYCTLREGFRSFRIDRIQKLEVIPECYPKRRRLLLREWKVEMQNQGYTGVVCGVK
jgi:predicted DNA-binding transcriptional regulator YafY